MIRYNSIIFSPVGEGANECEVQVKGRRLGNAVI